MKFHGIQITEGSTVTNLSVAFGTSFPGDPNEGELFFRSDSDVRVKGLYLYAGGNWDRIASTDSLSAPQAETFPSLANTGDLFYKHSNDITEGLYVYDGASWIPSASGAGSTVGVSGDATGTLVVGGTETLTLATVSTAGTAGSASSVPVITIDTKGRTTSATDTSIAISASQTTSGTFADVRIAQSNITQHQSALSLAGSQLTSGTIPDARIASTGVTQHQSSLSIAETQIPDGAILARVGSAETVSGSWQFNNPIPVGAPTLNSHATTKQYVDSAIAGLSWKVAVRVGTTANIALSGLQTIDGVSVQVDDRVLVKNQTTQSQNGVYVVSGSAWSRATDFDSVSPIDEVNSGAVFVQSGSTQADTAWTQTSPVTTVGTDSMTFVQFGGPNTYFGGAGLTLDANTFNVNTASSARIVVNTDNIDLATVTNSNTGSFSKLNVDSYGRVSGTTAVTTSDITPLIDGTYVNTIGDTMTGDLIMATTGRIRSSGLNLQLEAANGFALAFNTGGSERARITSAGLALFGLTAAVSSAPIQSQASTSAAIGATIVGRAADDTSVLNFLNNAGTTEKARIQIVQDDTIIIGQGSAATSRLRIDPNGNVAIGAANPGVGQSFVVNKTQTGAVNTHGVILNTTIQSDVTNSAQGLTTSLNTAAASFTLGTLSHISLNQATIGAGSAVTTQHGLLVGASLIGATNNYAVTLNIPAGAGRRNLNVSGTADNFIAGSVGIGTTTIAGFTLRTGKALTGSTYVRNIYAGGEVQPDVTSGGTSFESHLQLANGVAMSGNWQHFTAAQGSFGTGTLGTQYGFLAGSSLTGATNNFGFYSNIAAATGRWNFYANGTADNYFAGNVGIGITTPTPYAVGSRVLHVAGGANAAEIRLTTNDSGFAGAADGAVIQLSGTSLAIWNAEADAIRFGTTNQERMRIDASGNVGIGTNPTNLLHLHAAAGASLQRFSDTTNGTFGFIGSGNGIVSSATNDMLAVRSETSLVFASDGNNERMRIDSSGDVLVNRTTSSGLGKFQTAISSGNNIADFSNSSGSAGVVRIRTTTLDSAYLYLQNSGSGTTLSDGLQIGIDSTGQAYVINNEAAPLVFQTSALERMRIDAAGNVGVGRQPIAAARLVTSYGSDGGYHLGCVGATKGLRVQTSSIGTTLTGVDASLTTTYEPLALDGSLLTFETGANERMRIDGSGNVGIGTTSTGGGRLTVAGGNGIMVNGSGAAGYNAVQFINDNGITLSVGAAGSTALGWSSNKAAIGTVSNHPLVFGTNSVERMRIDTSGNVGIGRIPSALATLDVQGVGQSLIRIRGGGGSGEGGAFYVTNAGADTTSMAMGNPQAIIGGAPSTNAMIWANSELVAFVNGGERMRIDASGNVGIGTNSPGNRLHVYSPATTNVAMVSVQSANSSIFTINSPGSAGAYAPASQIGDVVIRTEANALHIASASGLITFGSPATERMRVTTTGITVTGTVTETSTIRIKKNVRPIEGALEKVLGLQGVVYDMIDDSAHAQHGLIAEEVQKVMPNVVYRDEDGEVAGVQYARIVAVLIEAMKEQEARIKALEAIIAKG